MQDGAVGAARGVAVARFDGGVVVTYGTTASSTFWMEETRGRGLAYIDEKRRPRAIESQRKTGSKLFPIARFSG